jgi:hypothetical protein
LSFRYSKPHDQLQIRPDRAIALNSLVSMTKTNASEFSELQMCDSGIPKKNRGI